MAAMGNARANAYWEAGLPPGFRRPPDHDMAQLRSYITDKYVSRRYADRAYPEPPTIDNYAAHPVRGAGGGGWGGGGPGNEWGAAGACVRALYVRGRSPAEHPRGWGAPLLATPRRGGPVCSQLLTHGVALLLRFPASAAAVAAAAAVHGAVCVRGGGSCGGSYGGEWQWRAGRGWRRRPAAAAATRGCAPAPGAAGGSGGSAAPAAAAAVLRLAEP